MFKWDLFQWDARIFQYLQNEIHHINKLNKTHDHFNTYTLVAQSCPTLCDPTDCSPPGPSAHGIFQAEYWSGEPFPSADHFNRCLKSFLQNSTSIYDEKKTKTLQKVDTEGT